MQAVLEALGEDPEREGLVRTPERSEKALRFLTSGYPRTSTKIVNGAMFEVKYDEMVIVKDIEFFSLCEHHLLPFFGKDPRGLSAERKGDRAEQDSPDRGYVRAAAADSGAADAADRARRFRSCWIRAGVGVICEARHFCMMMRGVEKQHSGTVTSAMLGAFRTNKETATSCCRWSTPAPVRVTGSSSRMAFPRAPSEPHEASRVSPNGSGRVSIGVKCRSIFAV